MNHACTKMIDASVLTGYTHNIENLGDTDMVTVMWGVLWIVF